MTTMPDVSAPDDTTQVPAATSCAVPASSTSDARDPRHATLSSLLFWLFLPCAVSLYAAILLAPKLWTHMVLDNRYRTGQRRISELHERIEDLEKVVHAFQNDPEFVVEFARADLAAQEPGEERIRVDRHLAWDMRRAETLRETPAEPLPWYAPLLRLMATSGFIRTATLLAAAAIIVLSFTFLHESQTARIRSVAPRLRQWTQVVANRYRAS